MISRLESSARELGLKIGANLSQFLRLIWNVSDAESTFVLCFRDQGVGGSNPLSPTNLCLHLRVRVNRSNLRL